MFRRKNKILIIDPGFLRFRGNDVRLKALKKKGWVIIVAPVSSVYIWEGK